MIREFFLSLSIEPNSFVPGPQSSHLVTSTILLLNFGIWFDSTVSLKRLYLNGMFIKNFIRLFSLIY